MKTIRNIIVSSILLASVIACSPPLIENPNSSASPSASASANANNTGSPTPSMIPTATPSPSLAPGEYGYDIPLKITTNLECSPANSPRNTYEVKADGTFLYLTTENGVELTREKKLSTLELDSLRSAIRLANIAKLAETDEAVKPGTPQTTECRTIETLTMNVNSKERSFDKNGREFIHSKEYFEAMSRIKSKLEDLKGTYQGEKYVYSFPVVISNKSECVSNTSDKRVLYQLTSDRNFNYILSENDLTRVAGRTLTESEFNEVKDLLKTLDIASLAESDTNVSPGSPQTYECRIVEETEISVNGTTKTFDRNGRKLNHSTAYLNALARLKTKFGELGMK
ncbi:hypothetical protein EON78_05965 [bacterium]|nr:MAG: hypothetical protein EON78_05965 [bacterium]